MQKDQLRRYSLFLFMFISVNAIGQKEFVIRGNTVTFETIYTDSLKQIDLAVQDEIINKLQRNRDALKLEYDGFKRFLLIKGLKESQIDSRDYKGGLLEYDELISKEIEKRLEIELKPIQGRRDTRLIIKQQIDSLLKVYQLLD